MVLDSLSIQCIRPVGMIGLTLHNADGFDLAEQADQTGVRGRGLRFAGVWAAGFERSGEWRKC